ncbi:MAG: hypothetical protein U0T84_13880 [Chitinophagales bacterium]
MKTKILVLYYTQTGQLQDAVNRFTRHLSNDAAFEVYMERLELQEPFPFPWSAFRFFNAFPDTFQQKPLPLKACSSRLEEDWDVVILAYQPWFLTPSPAMASFLQSAPAAKLLLGKKVVTLTASRNMWLGAQEKVKAHLHRLQATLIGNVALVDNAPNVVSLITILRWLLWGKKTATSLLPAAGVADADLEKAVVYGDILKNAITNNRFEWMQEQLNQAGAVTIKPELVLMEARGKRAFGIWSKFIGGAANGSMQRAIRVYVFMFLLPTAVLILSPLLMLISFLMLRLKREKLDQEVAYFSQNSWRGN